MLVDREIAVQDAEPVVEGENGMGLGTKPGQMEEALGPLGARASASGEPISSADTTAHHGESRPAGVLPVIVIAQFAGTSLWFAGNAVLPALQAEHGIDGGLATLTSAVQFGFIVGTAILALTGLADRFSARTVFAASAMAGAAANLLTLFFDDIPSLAISRGLVGIALAGIYPIGMKAAAGWFRDGLGGALGYLVGALVMGTALPHLLGSSLPWRSTLIAVSVLAAAGGALLFLRVPDGPFTKRSGFDSAAIPKLFRIPRFRGAALGYFGHMWELYTFWALLPVVITLHGELPVALTSFGVIAVGALGCVGGGLLVPRYGSRRVAGVQLAVSGACCVLFPFALNAPSELFVLFLGVWGIVVVGDSPQYSAINAESAPQELVGTGLALVTGIGFSLTIGSIFLAQAIDDPPVALFLLSIGPLVGLWGLKQANTAGSGQLRP